MVGITLTAEQIRAAPPDVRHWIEQQVAAMFEPLVGEGPQTASPHLASCTTGDAQAVLEQIQDLLPVVSVFFELGRDGASVPVQGMRAFRLTDILRHTRLESVDQVMECLELINEALRRVRGDPNGAICAFDHEGRCYVSEATVRAVLALWQGIVASHELRPDVAGAAPASRPAMSPPYRVPGYGAAPTANEPGPDQPVMPVPHAG
jgi:hypothetical protein